MRETLHEHITTISILWQARLQPPLCRRHRPDGRSKNERQDLMNRQVENASAYANGCDTWTLVAKTE